MIIMMHVVSFRDKQHKKILEEKTGQTGCDEDPWYKNQPSQQIQKINEEDSLARNTVCSKS